MSTKGEEKGRLIAEIRVDAKSSSFMHFNYSTEKFLQIY